MIRRSAAALGTAAMLVSVPAAAQQPAVAQPAAVRPQAPVEQQKPVAAPARKSVPVTVPPIRKPSTTVQARRPDDARIATQGFSVVLVVADLAAAGGAGDVPPAAQRALADIKDFLPYKSYKLLDAAWVLGQGQQTIRLRGPEEQQYELRLVTPPYASESGRVSVQFMLREADGEGAAMEYSMAERRRTEVEEALTSQHAERESRMAHLRSDLAAARQKGDEARARELQKEIEALPAVRSSARGNMLRKITSSRPIIETSFSMNVGETVVVGTSRLKENSKALIALLTAVPPSRGSTPPKESR